MTASTVPTTVALPPGVPPEPVVPLSVEQYHEMTRAGILLDGDSIELLEGWLVRKMSKNPSHSASTAKVRRQLEEIVPAGWSVDAQEPLTTDDSEPEPDIAVIRGLRENYNDRHPGPHEVGLLVEVADTSLERDRGWKKRIYAKARIQVYWIVNLVGRKVEVFTQPSGPREQPGYLQQQSFHPGDQIPVVLDGREVGRVEVVKLLP
jgi:Uma2 family endonuclease